MTSLWSLPSLPSPLTISPTPTCPKVSAEFLHDRYQAIFQRLVSIIPPHENPCDNTQPFYFVSRFLSNGDPLMPCEPGHSGIVYLTSFEVPPAQPMSLFALGVTKKAGHYLGEYRWDLAGEMTPEWFKGQTAAVRSSYVVHRSARLILMNLRRRKL